MPRTAVPVWGWALLFSILTVLDGVLLYWWLVARKRKSKTVREPAEEMQEIPSAEVYEEERIDPQQHDPLPGCETPERHQTVAVATPTPPPRVRVPVIPAPPATATPTPNRETRRVRIVSPKATEMYSPSPLQATPQHAAVDITGDLNDSWWLSPAQSAGAILGQGLQVPTKLFDSPPPSPIASAAPGPPVSNPYITRLIPPQPPTKPQPSPPPEIPGM
eukprot:TRINITY_DN3624_c0_g1_i1.p1 TRINITY_DN3624_c0_g1~~TRINITY_DN3624_c0_g1_i1.p1  ORF type:complete len:234 (+),score=31.08 TRINITY_DN3624_c0_g1_i1:48-704(+)